MSTTPADRDPEGNTVTSLEDKAELVRGTAFPAPPVDPVGPPPHREGTAHQKIDKARVKRVPFHQ